MDRFGEDKGARRARRTWQLSPLPPRAGLGKPERVAAPSAARPALVHSDVPILRRKRSQASSWASSTNSSGLRDRKSTRLNSSHSQISYAVFCSKKKKKKDMTLTTDSC